MSFYRILLPFCALFLLQQKLPGQSTTAFLWPSFREQVLNYHPDALYANTLEQYVNAQLFQARGGFDLKSFASYEAKSFQQKQYFSYLESGLKLPTYFGLEFKSTYNLATGTFLNPERSLPSNGQASFGLKWTLGQGLLIDDRRAQLKSAREGLGMGRAERQLLLSNLIYSAGKLYWEWALNANELRVLQEALQQAQLRHAALIESVAQGDKPSIDTLETYIQIQNRLLEITFTTNQLKNSQIELGTYFWGANQRQIPLQTNLEAPTLTGLEAEPAFSNKEATELVDFALESHPSLSFYGAKIRQLAVEKQLKTEKLKPVLDLDYHLLGRGWEFSPSPGENGAAVLINDIKWGVNFSYPITNRKARGDLQLTRLKIQQNTLVLQEKRAEIEQKVRQYHNELKALNTQVQLYASITNNYFQLLEAENEKFRQGESSIFLINTREQRWLDAQLKYLKLVATYKKTEMALNWAMGSF